MSFHIIIPARFASTRLPGKVLLDVAGKPLIQRVYESALQCGAKNIIIAVDDERVREVAKGFGAEVFMTAAHHTTGTDRLSEVAEKLQLPDEDMIVNLQGDQLLNSPAAIHAIVNAMQAYPTAAVTTLCTHIRQENELLDPNIVKVVLDKNGFALYFSRAPIPWDRDQAVFEFNKSAYYQHVGLYAYRARTLKHYACWDPSPLEELEKLEQLRVLWQGARMHVSVMEEALPPGVDTEADLIKLRSTLVSLKV